MSLLDISHFPEKELTTVMCCDICKGKMHEVSKSHITKILGAFLPVYKNFKTYRCEECYKVKQTRES